MKCLIYVMVLTSNVRNTNYMAFETNLIGFARLYNQIIRCSFYCVKLCRPIFWSIFPLNVHPNEPLATSSVHHTAYVYAMHTHSGNWTCCLVSLSPTVSNYARNGLEIMIGGGGGLNPPYVWQKARHTLCSHKCVLNNCGGMRPSRLIFRSQKA